MKEIYTIYKNIYFNLINYRKIGQKTERANYVSKKFSTTVFSNLFP